MAVRFLIDAQLPPSLADRLREAGHEAEHVNLIGLGPASDRRIWTYARSTQAVIITKDQDFADLARSNQRGAAVVWIRLGNTTSWALWRALEPVFPEILDGLAHGETLIEVA
jgi:predicted nuclease of predicted toxin-antitoxin system